MIHVCKAQHRFCCCCYSPPLALCACQHPPTPSNRFGCCWCCNSRRYASLYFVAGINPSANELLALEAIHHFVEVLDRYFGNVRDACDHRCQAMIHMLQRLIWLLARSVEHDSDKSVVGFYPFSFVVCRFASLISSSTSTRHTTSLTKCSLAEICRKFTRERY